jgi:hypothetical protein
MLGLDTTVSLGKQASASDPTTLARQSLQVYSITGGQSENLVDDEILGGGLNNSSDPTEAAPGLDDHKVTIKFPLCIAQAPWWFAAFFGTEAASGTDPDFEHLWHSGAALPYIFLEHKMTTGRYRRHFAMVGESLTIDLDAEREGFAQGEITFVGMKELKNSAALAGVVTATPDLDRPAAKLASVIYNGVAGGDLIGGKFTFARKLKRYRAADGTGIPYSVEQNGKSTLSGSLRTRCRADTIYDDGVAHTPRSLSLQLLRAAGRGMKFDMAHMRVNRTPISIEGADEIEQNYDYRAWQTTADAALNVTAMNTEDTIAFA